MRAEREGAVMIPFDEALAMVLGAAGRLDAEAVALGECLGRVLGEDAAADRDVPARPVSVMDGYACRRADLERELRVVETIAAGRMPERTVGEGECARIMTGAVVPEGADVVVMQEDVTARDGAVRVERVSESSYIRQRGEDVRRGQVLLEAGVRLGPAEVAILASAGRDRVKVGRRPRVAVAVTGDELVEPGEAAAGAQIRNSNGPQVCAQLERCGAAWEYLGIVRDDRGALEAAVERMMDGYDAVLLSGGVSVGDFDFVPEVLRGAGVELLFEKVALKPGKPTVFGVRGETGFFGLPGNPVSTFVVFELLVRPYLVKRMGGEHVGMWTRLRLAEAVRRRDVERLEFRPARVGADGSVRCLEYHGSAHIHAYHGADAMVRIPVGVGELEAGREVDVRLL